MNFLVKMFFLVLCGMCSVKNVCAAAPDQELCVQKMDALNRALVITANKLWRTWDKEQRIACLMQFQIDPPLDLNETDRTVDWFVNQSLKANRLKEIREFFINHPDFDPQLKHTLWLLSI